MRIFAFQGIRFQASGIDAGILAAPPYDQISPSLRDELHRTPHHFAHLSRPRGSKHDPHGHSIASEIHAQWLESSILGRDQGPSLYPYEIESPNGDRRLGLCSLVGLEDPETGIIRRHEQTVSKTVAERLGLLRSMQVDLEPILLLSEDDGGLDKLLATDVAGKALVQHLDTFGNYHRLFRVNDPARIRRYQQSLQDAPGLIADGHHRYQVASTYAREISASSRSPAAAKLSVITSLSSAGLAIDPIHRGLAENLSLDVLTARVVTKTPWLGADGEALAQAVAEAKQPAIGVRKGTEQAEIWQLKPAEPNFPVPKGALDLPVCLLHGVLLPEVGIPIERATDGTVKYRSDPGKLWSDLEKGSLALGIWLPPMTPESFAAAISDGDLLPPKSTRFMPKVVSGLVWASHNTQLL